MESISMKLSNGSIYQKALDLENTFNDNDLSLPVAVIFSIEKNRQKLFAIAQDIEKYRMEIIKKYGQETNNGSYTVSADKISEANAELLNLFAIEQNVDIYTFSIEDLGDVKLTSNQMNAILFMINN